MAAKEFMLTVSQLTAYLGNMMQNDAVLRDLSLRGEISNFHKHSSGHLYFSLKDDQSLIRCVMFRQHAMIVRFAPANGSKVILRGYVSLYGRDGQLQFYCEGMKQDGVGDLYLAFEALKEKLKGEGLFDLDKKRPLPSLPKTVGVVTSPTGAAIRDILRVSARRHPGLPVIIAPAKVQGEGAAQEIAQAIERLAPLVDVIICGRGGGSIEDLWAFNEEVVARAIAACPVPVVTGIGHETDFTIADFAADVRAATPSQAAELAVPEFTGMIQRSEMAFARATSAIVRRLDGESQRLSRLRSGAITRPQLLLAPMTERVSQLGGRISRETDSLLERCRDKHHHYVRQLAALNPQAVLERGYAIVFNEKGQALRSAGQVKNGGQVEIRLADGGFAARRED